MASTSAADSTAGDSTGRGAFRRRLRVLALLFPFLLVVLVETGLRLFDYPPRNHMVELARVLNLRDRRHFEPDAELLWRFRPDTAFDFGDPAFPPFHTNADGLRGRDVPRDPPASELRVICFGDSITFGIGVSDEHTLPSRIQARLRDDRRLAGRDVRVVNAGVPGYSSVQGLRLLRRLEHLRPDVVVWCFGMNDAKPSLGRPDAELRVTDALPGGLVERVADLQIVRLFTVLGASTGGGAPAESADAARVPVADFRETLEALREWAAARGVEVVVAETPQLLGLVVEQMDAVLAAARAAGANEVRGPGALLSQWTASFAPSDLERRVERTADDGIRVVFGTRDAADPRTEEIAEIEERRRSVAAWRSRLSALEAELPDPHVTRAELFRQAPLVGAFYIDNCHLTAAGADVAAAAIAREIAARCSRK